MPSFEYSLKHQAYIKQCSCCKSETIGTADQEESRTLFLKAFAPSNGEAGMADNMQSRCWICNSHRRRSLGVTLELLRDMHQAQEGVCAICSVPISLDRGARNPANVDHDDNTGKIRSLLCGNCNRGIGLFFHNEELLSRACDYVRQHREPLHG